MHAEAVDGPALGRGAALGRFVVLGCVGRGAMGEVYAAYDPELDRKIAIKLVRADRSGDAAENRKRLMREAQATAKVSHPNVVVVYDAGTSGDRVFIAMEFLEGHTLRYWLQERSRSWREILDTFEAAGRGLAAAHERDLVHRDFKPDNVMVAANGQVRVMDFGLARVTVDATVSPPWGGPASTATADLDSTAVVKPGRSSPPPSTSLASSPMLELKLTQTGAMLGTPAYMSPEQFEGRSADARSDQFSFCVALWEALYGERPFAGATFGELCQNVAMGKLTPAPAGSPVPAWVRSALTRGMCTASEDRHPSMAALLAELDRRPGAGRGGFAGGAAAKLAGIWEPAVDTAEKQSMRQSFLATGKAYAESAFAGASEILDRYTRRWSELYVDVCEATHVRGEQSTDVLDLRMACLLEGLDDLKALCRLFQTATAEAVQNAVSAATALGTLERCQDVELLRAVVRPPDDQATRVAVAELRARVTEVRALLRVGRYREGLEAAEPLVENARRVGYGPTLAEALFVRGALEVETVRTEAALASMEEAVWTAELARHDEVAVEAASFMIAMSGWFQSRFDVAETWCRHTEMLLRRMGGHDVTWGWYLNNRALVRAAQGRVDEAIEDAKLAIAAKERALGPDAADIGNTLSNLADCLVRLGRIEEGVAESERAVRIQSAGYGPEHPRTAVGLTNHAEFLSRAGRFAEVPEYAERAIAIFERESDREGLPISYPLWALGLSYLGAGRAAEAVPILERSVQIRDRLEQRSAFLGDVHFALGRALLASGGDRARAIGLVRRAREEFNAAPTTPIIERDRADLDAWLAANS